MLSEILIKFASSGSRLRIAASRFEVDATNSLGINREPLHIRNYLESAGSTGVRVHYTPDELTEPTPRLFRGFRTSFDKPHFSPATRAAFFNVRLWRTFIIPFPIFSVDRQTENRNSRSLLDEHLAETALKTRRGISRKRRDE